MCEKPLVKMVYLILIRSTKSAFLRASHIRVQHKPNDYSMIQGPSRNIHKTPEQYNPQSIRTSSGPQILPIQRQTSIPLILDPFGYLELRGVLVVNLAPNFVLSRC